MLPVIANGLIYLSLLGVAAESVDCQAGTHFDTLLAASFPRSDLCAMLTSGTSRSFGRLRFEPRTRLPSRRLLLVSAASDKETLVQQVQRANEVLGKVGLEVSKRLLGTVSAEDVDGKGAQQTAAQQRESFWIAERASWEAREAALQQQISKLQDSLIEIAKLQASQQLSLRDTTPKLTLEDAPEISKGPEATTAASPRDAQPLSIIEEARTFLPEEEVGFTPPSAEEYPGLEDLEDDDTERVRNSLHMAFAAVDDTDVLSTDYDRRLSTIQTRNGSHNKATLLEPGQSTQPQSGPPVLMKGADDIFWMSHLHTALMKASLYPSEDELEDWIFGEQTESAVMTYQAAAGLPETGIVDDPTWSKLLGPGYRSIQPPEEPAGTPSAESTRVTSSDDAGTTEPATVPRHENMAKNIKKIRKQSELENRRKQGHADPGQPPSQHYAWPILREGDGGRDVHHLHVALEQKGFIADEEDQRWWFFGDSTHSCVLTFQACSGLPESGVVEGETWLALLQPGASPDSLDSLTNDFEDDMTNDSERIWLLGEQRWAKLVR